MEINIFIKFLLLSLLLLHTRIVGEVPSNETDIQPDSYHFFEYLDYTYQVDKWTIFETADSFFIENKYKKDIRKELIWNTGGAHLHKIDELTRSTLLLCIFRIVAEHRKLQIFINF